jgi:copper transport protein
MPCRPSSTVMMRLLAAIALLMLALLPAPSAFAHAVLIGTEPSPDAVLDRPPPRIVLTFNEPVSPVVLRVLDTAGVELPGVTFTASDAQLRADLPPLDAGGYIVSWRVVSADSHPIGGSFRFAVGTPPPEWLGTDHADIEARRSLAWTVAGGLNRAVYLVCLLLLAGAGLYLPALPSGAPSWASGCVARLRYLAVPGLVSAFMLIPLQGGLLVGAPVSGLLDAAVWQAGASSPVGRMAFVGALAIIALCLSLRFWALPSTRVLGAFAGLAGAASLALSGHAENADPRVVAVPALMLHAAAAAFWLGALPFLLAAIRHLDGRDAARVLQRFSQVAVVAVALLVLGGATLSLVQLGDPGELSLTRYVAILAAKLCLVALLLAIALANRNRHVPALARAEPGADNRLRRNIRIEVAAMAIVLALTAMLGFTTPPRALQDASAHEGHHGHERTAPLLRELQGSGGIVATMELDPGRRGYNRLTVRFLDEAGRPIAPVEVTMRVSSPELGIEPVERALLGDGDAYFVDTADMALPGRWVLRIDARLDDFEKPIFETAIDLE